jgi:IS605 OrfB family transposase
MKTVITGAIHNGDFDSLKQLMRDQSSCVRYAYQRIHKDKMTYKNDIVKSCKPLYMSKLNQRYIQDAVMKAKDINQEHALFGGKKNWKDMLSGLLPKKDWQATRDNEVYSRGDRSKQGNPNIRVISSPEGYRLRVGLSGPRQFLFFNLYIPEKFREQFELYKDCYDVRIKNKNGKFYVMIGYEIPDTPILYKLCNGAIGVDTNPDGLGTVNIDREGNLISHEYLSSERLPFAKHDKRQHDVEALALQVVNKAILANKGIVIEDLKFNDGKHGKKKFNRMRHNFIYSQLLRAIERRAAKDGVEVKKINPAFTSIAGILKYQKMYSLNRHTAAALVIGRRGMGIMETIRVRVENIENKKLNLAGRGFEIALSLKAYSYFKILYRVLEVKTSVLTAPCLSPIQWNTGTS